MRVQTWENRMRALTLTTVFLGLIVSPAIAEPARPGPAPTVFQSAGIVPGSEDDFRIGVGDRVFFADRSADLSLEALSVLARQAKWLDRYPGTRITIAGNTHEAGSAEFNTELGEQRAAVAAYVLILLGVSGDRIAIVSNGDRNRLDPRDNDEARSVNRNAHMRITDGG